MIDSLHFLSPQKYMVPPG